MTEPNCVNLIALLTMFNNIWRIRVGSEVMTSGGLFGTVTGLPATQDPADDVVEDAAREADELGPDQVEIEISPGVRVRFLAVAIARVLEPETGTTSLDQSSEQSSQDDTTAR